jgi:hypothetical protein
VKPKEDQLLQRITLQLARTPEFPAGSPSHGYEIVAPLDRDGHLDKDAWHKSRGRCRVRRFWAGEPDRLGHLLHRAGGSGGATWTIDYDDISATDTEDQGYHLGTHRFVEGDYVSIRAHGREPMPFRVAALDPA